MKTRFLVLVLLAAACGSNPFEEEGPGQVLPAIIKFEDRPVVINIPETAEVGEPVTVSVFVYTIGGCHWDPGTHVTDLGHLVLVEPFDSIIDRPPDLPVDIPIVCGAAKTARLRETTITFSEQGMVFVVFRGREWPANKPYSTRRRIFVR